MLGPERKKWRRRLGGAEGAGAGLGGVRVSVEEGVGLRPERRWAGWAKKGEGGGLEEKFCGPGGLEAEKKN